MVDFCASSFEGTLTQSGPSDSGTSPYLVPESERPGRRYYDEDCIGPRNREPLREQIADYVLLMLGAPAVEIELDKQQLSLAVDEGMRVFEEYAPASSYQHYYFQTTPNVARYEMPCDIGLIRSVVWNTDGDCDAIQSLGGGYPVVSSTSQGWGGSTGWYQGMLPTVPMWGMMGEFTIQKQYQETFRRMSSAEGSWMWSPENAIVLFPNPQRSGNVIVHYLQRMKDWPEVHRWMQEYALAQAKEMLGRIRSKFQQLPGPSGGMTLDGDRLIEEARAEKEKLKEDLYTMYGIEHMLPLVG